MTGLSSRAAGTRAPRVVLVHVLKRDAKALLLVEAGPGDPAAPVKQSGVLLLLHEIIIGLQPLAKPAQRPIGRVPDRQAAISVPLLTRCHLKRGVRLGSEYG